MNDAERQAEFQRQFDILAAKLAEEVEKCRYCKTARKRLRVRLEAQLDREVQAGYAWALTQEQIDNRVATHRCHGHQEKGRLLWATSPVSETYWAS